MLPFHLSLIVGGILLSATIQAGVYRWVDENGVTVYSQVPPPADTQKKQMDAPPSPPNTEKEAWEEVNQDWRKMRDREDIGKEQTTADSEQNEKQQAVEKNCSLARHTIEQLDNSRRMAVKTANGFSKLMSPAEREEQLEKAREMEKKYCH